MIAMASPITNLTIVYSTIYSGTGLRKHQSSTSLAFVRGIHWWPANSQHKGPVMLKCFHLMASSWTFWLIGASPFSKLLLLQSKVNMFTNMKVLTVLMFRPKDCRKLGQYHVCWCMFPCVTRSLSATILVIQDRWLLVFHEERFQQPTPSQCEKMLQNVIIFSCFLKTIQPTKGQQWCRKSALKVRSWLTPYHFITAIVTLWKIRDWAPVSV